MMCKDQSIRPEELNRIPTPALICFPETMEENIRRMIEIAGSPDRLWVHIKTVKAPDILLRLMAAGITHFKCATFAEAEMAGRCGAKNVLWAYPLVGPNIRLMLELQRRFPETGWFALADHPAQIQAIGHAARQEGTEIRLMADVDLGMHRTGVPPEKLEEICSCMTETDGVRVQGIHAYDGHVHASSPAERQALADAEHAALDPVVTDLREKGIPLEYVIWGGTPTFPCHSTYPQASLSPGTCVLHDAGYARHFPDLPFIPAAMVLTRVISHPSPDTFTLDLGYKGLAADAEQPRARLRGCEEAEPVLQSEEHWVLRMPAGHRRPEIGEVLYAIPSHICPTVHLYPSYLVIRDGAVAGEWPIPARNRSVKPLDLR